MQMSGKDVLFLAMETPQTHGHTGGLLILDPSGRPGFGFDAVKAMVAERMPLVPRFTWKLREVPMGLDRPYWVPDPDFRAERHMQRIAVPAPGGPRELAELCGHLYSAKLDRRKPLWEIWFIEGLSDGRVALLVKMHHCLMDGVSGSALGTLLCDLEPDPAPRPRALDTSDEEVAVEPSDLEMWWRATTNLAAMPANLAVYAGQALQRGLTLFGRNGSTTALPRPGSLPRLAFNHHLSARRAFSWTSLPLAGVKDIKDAAGVKLNDVVLEICGAAMRRYHEKTAGSAVSSPLVLTCAVSTRGEGGKKLGNQLAQMNVAWPAQVEDPVARLRAVSENAEAAKDLTRALRSTAIRPFGDTLPPGLIQLASQLSAMPPEPVMMSNAVVSNVPGPPVPLYCAGARIEALYPLSILAAGMGLNFTVISYADRLDFGLTFDPELVKEPWRLAAEISSAYEALHAAVLGRRPRSAAVAKEKRPRPARRASRIRVAPVAARAKKNTRASAPQSAPTAS